MQLAIVDRQGGRNLPLGVLFGIGAGALWGLVFLTPEMVRAFSPLQLTIGRYLAYGLISATLIAPRWRMLQQLGRREWLALCWLSLAGNTLYYILLSSAVQLGGIAMTSLVIGFIPVAVTIAGSRDEGAVSLRRLAPSLLFCSAGAICIGWQAIAIPTGSVGAQLIGLGCAIGALAAWSIYAINNSRWLVRLDHVTAHDWNLLIGIVTGAQSLVLIPVSLMLDDSRHDVTAWAEFAAVSVGVAVFASILGSLLWNRMSRLLPLTLVGQMILFETLFALIYCFLWERRGPTLLEAAAFALVVASVLSCIGAHRGLSSADPAPAG
ncbi:DMT family transporter [Sphingomonas sp. DG1-23]|uniref:DMT family transporter n=1 Tax=Sphingomonas sp. DG1-23 TaxID=3068316 RepID=UPI00273EBF93|nr:DMT family transporter [Sphingomonas sp. DG1-23]MDP5280368.1 DMT family transporter [Sphingomonas sp. DG1-23]